MYVYLIVIRSRLLLLVVTPVLLHLYQSTQANGVFSGWDGEYNQHFSQVGLSPLTVV